MVEGFARDRLMPALLDRLLDERPQERQEAEGARTMTRTALRQSVLRDLTWLLNAQSASAGDIDPERHPHALRSGINYGLPPLAGQLLSKLPLRDLERMLRQVIIDFEPRILADSIVVRGIAPVDPLGHHNAVSFEITAQLWAQPYPLELLLRSELDLETGLVELRDTGNSAGPARAARPGVE